jgi:hypothetical protein
MLEPWALAPGADLFGLIEPGRQRRDWRQRKRRPASRTEHRARGWSERDGLLEEAIREVAC